MFREAAARIRTLLAPVRDQIVLNVGSSTAAFYRTAQPYIWADVMAPLLERGNALINIDPKGGDGVHLRRAAEDLGLTALADVVLCCNLLEHVEHPRAVLRSIAAALKPGGLLVLDGPATYPYHADPIDTLLRFTTPAVCDALVLDTAQTWVRESFETITRASHPQQTSALVLYRKQDRGHAD